MSMHIPDTISTLDASLRATQERYPDVTGFSFIEGTGNLVAELSYRELDRRARAIGAALQARGLAGERVLLLYVPGLDFIAALYGCFYAGAVAVPAYPPEAGRMERALPRLRAVVSDVQPKLVLSTSLLLDMVEVVFAAESELAALPREASDVLALGGYETSWRAPSTGADDLALVQYTSGSTSTPKGVMVSHRNILTNLRQIQATAKQDASRVVASWVPFYHDLGLMGGILLPVLLGGRAVMMSPVDFMQHPLAWLQAIHKYRATDTFVPNFALDLCVRKTSPEMREGLDLSSLKVLVVAAEPVRQQSLQRFIETFSPHGLDPGAVSPGYGLAEAVLGVSGGPIGVPYRCSWLNSDALTRDQWVVVERGHKNARAVIACGRPLDGITVEIVETTKQLRPAPQGKIGEIWVSGPTVAQGYWGREQDTTKAFRARLDNGDPRLFLRTGDYGYLKDGDLYITGRIKDVIIIRGKNHYPQDIELTVEHVSPLIRPGCVAVFGIDQDGAERVVIVAEIDPLELPVGEERDHALGRLIRKIRAAVNVEHAVQVYGVALIKPRTIEKAASGKIARHASRRRYLAGTLMAEAQWSLSAINEQPLTSGPGTDEDMRRSHILAALHRVPETQRPPLLIGYLERELSRVLGRSATRLIDPEVPLQELGLDSLGVIEIAGRVEKDLGIDLPVAKLMNVVSLGALVDHLLAQMAAHRLSPPNLRHSGAPLVVTLSPITARCPFFCVGGAGGATLYLRPLAAALGADQPFYALQYPGLDGGELPAGSIESMGRRLLEDVRALQPHGPYVLGGHSLGGMVAYEMAHQLVAAGERVLHLVMMDSVLFATGPHEEAEADVMAMFELINGLRRMSMPPRPPLDPAVLAQMSTAKQREHLRTTLHAECSVIPGCPVERLAEVYRMSIQAMQHYRAPASELPVTLLRATAPFPQDGFHPGRQVPKSLYSPQRGWEQVCRALKVLTVPGDHFSMMVSPHVEHIAQVLRGILDHAGAIEIGVDRLVAWHSGHAAAMIGGSLQDGPVPSEPAAPQPGSTLGAGQA